MVIQTGHRPASGGICLSIVDMRKYLQYVLVISFISFLTLTLHAVSGAEVTTDEDEQAVNENDDPTVLFERGVNYLKSGMYKEAIESLKQAIKIDPDYAKAHKTLGYVYLNLYMNKDAIESLKQVVRINADATSHYNLGFIYDRSGMYKESVEVYKRAIFINPDYRDAYNRLGNAYGELGMYEKAIETLNVAIERDPDHAMSYYNLGLIYNASNDKDSAFEQHEILNSLDFELADKLFGLIRK